MDDHWKSSGFVVELVLVELVNLWAVAREDVDNKRIESNDETWAKEPKNEEDFIVYFEIENNEPKFYRIDMILLAAACLFINLFLLSPAISSRCMYY